MTRRTIEYHKHNLGKAEIDSIASVLQGVFLTTGNRVAEFERALEEMYSAYAGMFARGVTSGTHALHLTLAALGIGPGDEVITTPMTFIATVEAICYVGATPVFVDVEPHTGNIDVDRIERAITCRTKAIMPVHLYGNMVDMRRVRGIADHFNLFVVEDAAHCLEGSRDGVCPGMLSDAACFSFQALKVLTSGEGGAILTRNLGLAERLGHMRNHGMTRGALAQREVYFHADVLDLGYKYAMSELQAALLLPQMPKMARRYADRAEIAAVYRARLSDFPLEMPRVPPNTVPAHYMFPIWISPSNALSMNDRGLLRDRILQDIRSQGVGVTVQYLPVHAYTYFRERFGLKMGMFPNAERIGASVIALPFYPQLTLDDLEYVIDSVGHALRRAMPW